MTESEVRLDLQPLARAIIDDNEGAVREEGQRLLKQIAAQLKALKVERRVVEWLVKTTAGH